MGGALAVQYALDALQDPALKHPQRVVLVSPMIGIHGAARFAGLAGLPAVLPAFAKAAWLDRVPEYNPFKYNSFPVHAARESYELTEVLQRQVAQAERAGRLGALPPILTFQSVLDSTVLTSAVVELYARLPANGSELVLLDLNQAAVLTPLLRSRAEDRVARLLPKAPRRFGTTLVTNATPGSSAVVARTTAAGSDQEESRPLGLEYPADLFSMSHIALPFPESDGLYGMRPDPADDFGVNLGAKAVRGERGYLIVSLDALLRATSNPFFPYVIERVKEVLAAPDAAPLPPEGD
jgi:alpha-beta hydrolase superfamily lysophospholipase